MAEKLKKNIHSQTNMNRAKRNLGSQRQRAGRTNKSIHIEGLGEQSEHYMPPEGASMVEQRVYVSASKLYQQGQKGLWRLR